MKKILFILFLFWANSVISQNAQSVVTKVNHGDTVFLVTTTNSYSIDSTFRKEYLYHGVCDSALVGGIMTWVCNSVMYDSVQYWYKYRTFVSSVKDSVQLNLIPHKTINNTSALGIGNIAVVGGGGAPTFINLTSLFSSTSTTPATVTGWSFAVTSGKTYRITVIADYQTAATTTGGILGISLTTATGTVRGYASGTVVNTAAATELKIPIRTTSGAGSTLTTTGVTATNSPHYIGMDITFTCTGSGIFNIVWGTEVNASAAQLNANSTLLYQALN